MKVILGAGQLGQTIVNELLKDCNPQDILLVNKSGRRPYGLPDAVDVTAADVTNKHSLEFVAREAAMIYSCTDVPYADWGIFYPAAAAALAYALKRTNVPMVFADNLYSYGNVAGAVMHERLPHAATTKKGKIRAAVLDMLMPATGPLRERVAIVKAADFIGPGIHKGVLGTEFINRLHGGKIINLFGRPDLPHTFTYINDMARAMINAGDAQDAFGQVWHAPNSTPLSVKEWIAKFEEQVAPDARLSRIPKIAVRAAGLFNSTIRELHELAYQFENAYLVDHSKYPARFGDHSTDHDTVVTETLEWHRRQVGT